MSCCTLYRDRGARTAADRMWAVARYYDISSKADRGDIFIVHDQKSSYRTPLTHTTFIWKVMILLLEYVSTTDHNPTATMGHSIHKVDIRKPLTHTTPYTLSVICPVQWNSSVKRTPLQSARCHWMWAFAHSSRLRCRTAVRSRPDEDDEHADELPWDGLWQFVQKFFDYANRLLQQLSGGAGLRWSWRWRCCIWRSWAGVVTTCGMRLWGQLNVLPNYLKWFWKRLTVEKWTFNSWATALVDIPAVSMPIARSHITCVCSCVIKLHILEWPFIVASLRHTCAIIMLSNQHLDMPHLWGWMDNLGKREVLTNTDLDRFVKNIWEK